MISSPLNLTRLLIQPLEFNAIIEKLSSSRDFDAVVLGWQAGAPPDPIVSKSALLPSGESYGAFPNQSPPATEWEKRLQALILENSSTNDIEWSENLPEIDLVAPNFFVAVRNRFGNCRPSPLANYTYWNVDELFIRE